ncbi:TATA element modulatory factor-like isoform X2 [Branchiostoma lanceolatum]|uniref:TATA element modulatory factor-like isoform X2 n=1 Tax=Branchiostoma lanceolatum TaxID=7740 RepID=UPI003455A655
MSWFESASFSSLAKTALDSAQKSIDRVLDIQDEGGEQGSGASASLSQTTGKKSSGGGWAAWISPTSKQKSSSSPTPASAAQKKTSPARNLETDEFFADFLGGTSQAKRSPKADLKQPADTTPVPKQLPITPSQTKLSPRPVGLNALSSTEKQNQRKKQPGQFKLQLATSPTSPKPQAKENIPTDAVVSISLTEERNVSGPKETFDIMSSSSNSDLSASSESQSAPESGPEKETVADFTASSEMGNTSSKFDPLGALKLDEVQINHLESELEAKDLTGGSVVSVSSSSSIHSGEKENSGLGRNADFDTSTAIAVEAEPDDSSFSHGPQVEMVLETTLDASSQSTLEDENKTQTHAPSQEQVRDEKEPNVEDLEQTFDGKAQEISTQQTADLKEVEETNLTEKSNEITSNDTEEDKLRQEEPQHTRDDEPPLVDKEESSKFSNVEETNEVSSSNVDKEMPNSISEEDDATANVQEMYREQNANSEPVDTEYNGDCIDGEKEETVSQDGPDSLEIHEEKEKDQVPSDSPEELNHGETESTDKIDTTEAFLDKEPTAGLLDNGTDPDHVQDSSGQQQLTEENSTSQNNGLDPQKLLKKLADMAEVLQAREARLLELSKQNMDLEETGNILRVQLQQAEQAHEAEMTDINSLTEEFTERIASTERKLQAVMKEKETMGRQLKSKEEELCRRVNDKQMAQLLQEKDEQIEALMEEGQKLSKQQLQSSNIIKKLRAKEKESDSVIKSQKERLDKLQENVDHLTHVLDAKEDIDKQQKDAIKKLNSALEKQTKELTIAKSELEEAQDRVRSMQSALDSSYKEIGELHKANAARNSQMQDMTLSAQLQAKEELRLALEQEQEKANLGHEKLVQQVEDLRLSLQRAENQQSRQEDLLRQEISDMQQRLQQADARNQELSQSVTAATRPLLRQIENLQSNFSAQTSSWERVEKNLTERLTESQSQLAEASEKERMATETMMETKARLTSLESKCALLRQEKSRLLAEIEMERAKVNNMEDARHREQAQLEALQKTSEKQKEDWTKEKLLLENQLEMERLRVDTEKKKTFLAQEQAQKDRDRQWSKIDHGSRSHSRSSSVSDTSQNSSFFQPIQGDTSDTVYSPLSPMTNSTSGSLLDSMRSASTSTLFEGLQSTLKMREGEIAQLQEEIVRLERQRAAMGEELVSLSSQNQDLLTQVEQVPTLSEKVKNLEQRYNAMLQMYGEKAEEADELKMDLEDIKAMYKQQISDLLSKMT